jgi:membrane protease subunit HflK
MTQPTPNPPAAEPRDAKKRPAQTAVPLPAALTSNVPLQGRGIAAALAAAGLLGVSVLGVMLSAGLSGTPWSIGVAVAGGGLVVALGSALAYVFRRQAAVETVEIEELERDGRAGQSLFNDLADARPAERRVRRVYEFVLPLVTVLAISTMFAIGIPALLSSIEKWQDGLPLAVNSRPAGAAAAAAVLAFACFLVGRYLVGLAKDASLQLLRGPGGFLVGIGVLLLLGALALGAADFNSTDPVTVLPLRIVATLAPAVACLLALELTLNLLLELYRPRRPGEQPRAAFDSRLLALFSSPGGAVASIGDALNYQFGFEVSRTWLYRLLARSLAWLLAGGAVALLLLSCLFLVEPHQRAVVTTFGRAGEESVGPGLHFKAPWPIAGVQKYDVERLRTLSLGNTNPAQPRDLGRSPVEQTPLLYSNITNTSEGDPLLLGNRSIPTDETSVGVSFGLAQLLIDYRIGDLQAYLRENPYADDPADPDRLLRQLAEDVSGRVLMGLDFDDLAGAARQEAAAHIERELAAAAAPLGYELAWVGLVGVRPVDGVADVYLSREEEEAAGAAAVAEARKEETASLTAAAGSVEAAARIAELIDAEVAAREAGDAEAAAAAGAEAERVISNARGAAAALLSAAQAEKLELVLTDQGRVARYQGDREAYRTNPDLYRTRALLAALRENLPGTRIYVLALDEQQRAKLQTRLDNTVGNTNALDLDGVIGG